MRGRTTAARRDGRATIGARVLAAAAMTCGVLVGTPTAAMAITAQQAVDALNARRAAHGIPAGVTHLEMLSAGCLLHNTYMAQNGYALTHAETPTAPGYTLLGARVGAEFSASEVLARFGRWTATATPWDVSPGHLYLMMSPGMSRAGYSENFGFQCMRFRYGPSAGPPAFYSVPGNGRADVPLSQIAQSATGVPQTLVGIPAGQATGPNLLLYSSGLGNGLRASDASLTGPGGQQVEVRMVDELNGGGLYAGGGVMVPVAPLAPGTYTARVVWQTPSGASAAQQFVFTTEGAAAPPPTPVPDPVLVPPPPAGTTGPDEPGNAEPAGDAGEKPIDPRLIPREQAPVDHADAQARRGAGPRRGAAEASGAAAPARGARRRHARGHAPAAPGCDRLGPGRDPRRQAGEADRRAEGRGRRGERHPRPAARRALRPGGDGQGWPPRRDGDHAKLPARGVAGRPRGSARSLPDRGPTRMRGGT